MLDFIFSFLFLMKGMGKPIWPQLRGNLLSLLFAGSLKGKTEGNRQAGHMCEYKEIV